jgi:hypothetical protein
MKHRIKWEQANYGINNPRAYVICCSCGHWIAAKTRADALAALHEHAKAPRPDTGEER